jgi:hypothetical protein
MTRTNKPTETLSGEALKRQAIETIETHIACEEEMAGDEWKDDNKRFHQDEQKALKRLIKALKGCYVLTPNDLRFIAFMLTACTLELNDRGSVWAGMQQRFPWWGKIAGSAEQGVTTLSE